MTFRRLRAGRYWTYDLDGHRAKSVTTLLSGGIPKPNLLKWAAEQAVNYIAAHLEELADPEKRQPALDWAVEEHTRARNRAAAKGTDIHVLAQRFAGGEDVDVPDNLSGYVDAYLLFLTEWQPELIAVEAGVANRHWQYAGSIDLLARLRNGQLALIDIKTGASGIWPETCLQVAAYRHAEVILDPQGREQPMPATHAGYGLWLRDDGTYELLPLESGDEMFAVFLHAAFVAGFMDRAKAKENVIGLPLAAPAEVPA